jgi:hypothetical protein
VPGKRIRSIINFLYLQYNDDAAKSALLRRRPLRLIPLALTLVSMKSTTGARKGAIRNKRVLLERR